MIIRRIPCNPIGGRNAAQLASGLLRSVALWVALIAVPAQAAETFDQAHARFARVLSAVVKNASVDYAKLKAAPAELDAYLKDVAAVPATEFARWSEGERLALLLNLYNAQTLRLIVDHYPLQSIRRIGSLPGAAWRERIVRQGGQIMTLSHLENKIIRVDYREPRMHFALVCAAVGCPPLRSEPYVGARLNEQLDDQARQFLATAGKNRFDAASATLHLSPIFKWYDEDFIKPAGSLAAYVKPFLPEAQRNALADPAKVKVRFTDYDWALNELKQP
ncbi:MAG: DUF547 domain-containing protein [Verrucomicrobia bacterium]|nr:DUF547 domain-containing protein [Verrucomicrobiota bacterium]